MVDCTGATPGAFTSINAALATLDPYGPHVVTVIGPCTENVFIVQRQNLSIQAAPNTTATILNASTPPPHVILIDAATGITLRGLVIHGGRDGVVIRNASRATISGSTIENAALRGINLSGSSTLNIDTSTIRNNGRQGVQVGDSILNVDGCVVETNGMQGVNATRSQVTVMGYAAEAIFRGNGGTGLRGVYSSQVMVYGVAKFLNNTAFGISAHLSSNLYVEPGYDANDMPVPNVIEGNLMGGINSGWTSNDQVYGPLLVRNNGSPSSGGVGITVGLNTTLTLYGDPNDPIWDVEISGNYGPGILGGQGVMISLNGVKILNNSGDGINLSESSGVALFPPNWIVGNSAASITCDATGWVAGDWSGIAKVDCRDTGNKNPNRRSIFKDKEMGKGKDK